MGKHYTLKEKQEILEFYKEHTTSETIKKFNLKDRSRLSVWSKQLKNNSLSDSKSGSYKGPNKGRPKKWATLDPEKMSRDELIKYVKALEDIKKLEASLEKKNIKKSKN